MDKATRQLIEAIHATPAEMVLAVTGGGASAIGALLAVPGGSCTVLQACVPYSEAALADWLGGSTSQACSEATARAMAMAALERARLLSPDENGVLVGIGATAALASDRPKRGQHRVHVAWQTSQATGRLSLVLDKNARSRADEESLACELVLLGIAEAAGIAPALELDLRGGERVDRHRIDAPREWQQLARGQRAAVERNMPEADPPVLFPGAFNPVHQGHRQMAGVAEAMLGRPAVFELSIANVDKRPLDFIDIAGRVEQFANHPLVLTRAATFVEKAKLYPGATFVVGADTIERIGDAKYYAAEEGSPKTNRDAALEHLAELGCKFLVFGRLVEGDFQTLSELHLPPALRQLCEPVPESQFRHDVSSTELRERD